MELVEVYIGSKFGHLKFKPWYRAEISDSFGVTSKYYGCIDVWYHEFAEESIWYTLRDIIGISINLLNTESISLVLPNGETETYIPCHVIASLHGLSYFHDDLIDSDKYAQMLKWKS